MIYLNGIFALYPILLTKWLELNNFLTQVFRGLSVSWPSNVVVRPVPSNVDYVSSFETEDAACDVARYTLQAFHRLISLCSWRIVSYMKHTNDFSWIEVLLSKALLPTMVKMLQTSPLIRFSLLDQSVDVMVDVMDDACLPYICHMVNVQVPVYIY